MSSKNQLFISSLRLVNKSLQTVNWRLVYVKWQSLSASHVHKFISTGKVLVNQHKMALSPHPVVNFVSSSSNTTSTSQWQSQV